MLISSQGTNGEVVVRRAFRRIGSSQIFSQLKRNDIPLSELYRQRQGTNKKFVLVEEERLEELTKFENILREEKEKLGEQCALVISNVNTTSRLPVPAVRLAVHNLCEAEMRKAAHDIKLLVERWSEFYRKSGYNKTKLYFSDSIMKSTPVSERPAMMKQMKQTLADWLLKKNRDTMEYEDDLSQLNERYLNAQLRRRDYDRYFILATRYGVYSEEEYARDAMPGERYYRSVQRAARMLQRLWAVYWPIKNMRMNRAARLFQTIFRGHRAYITWHPIIRLRIRVGKTAVFKHMWKRWGEYVHLLKEIKSSLTFYLETYVSKCFVAWRDYIRVLTTHNKDLLNRFVRRLKNIQAANMFIRWNTFTQNSLRTKLFARRILQNPHFHWWVEYTNHRKHLKFLGKYAKRIQGLCRGFVMRKRYLRAYRAVVTLQGFNRIVNAKLEKLRRRQLVIKSEYAEWLPEETKARETRANEKERRRLIWEQQIIQEKETALILDLKRHLHSSNGRFQLNEIAYKLREVGILDEQGNKVSSISKRESLKLAQQQLLQQCGEIGRLMGKHDFSAKNPPLYRCADNRCRAVFVTMEQYHEHMVKAPNHGGKEPQFSRFHLRLKTSKFQESLRAFLVHEQGVGSVVNRLDLWIAIQDWRRTSISTESFVHKAINIYETFLREGCTRSIDMNLKEEMTHHQEIEEIFQRFEAVKYREFEGMYKVTNGRVTFWRRLFGMEGKQYEAWTTENMVFSNSFDEVEWITFLSLYEIVKDSAFYETQVGKDFLAEEEEAERIKDEVLLSLFGEYRSRNILYWTREFVRMEKKIAEKADELVSYLLELEVGELWKNGSELEGNYATFLVMHEEQRVHEEMNLLADDAIFWAMENTVAALCEHFISTVIDGMWENPELRKQLLEFAGYLHKNPRSRLLINTKARNEGHEWFNKFVNQALQEEKDSLPLDPDQAVLRIQRVWRGIRGRNVARKLFVKVFTKT
jgi:hypothetical protein